MDKFYPEEKMSSLVSLTADEIKKLEPGTLLVRIRVGENCGIAYRGIYKYVEPSRGTWIFIRKHDGTMDDFDGKNFALYPLNPKTKKDVVVIPATIRKAINSEIVKLQSQRKHIHARIERDTAKEKLIDTKLNALRAV